MEDVIHVKQAKFHYLNLLLKQDTYTHKPKNLQDHLYVKSKIIEFVEAGGKPVITRGCGYREIIAQWVYYSLNVVCPTKLLLKFPLPVTVSRWYVRGLGWGRKRCQDRHRKETEWQGKTEPTPYVYTSDYIHTNRAHAKNSTDSKHKKMRVLDK